MVGSTRHVSSNLTPSSTVECQSGLMSRFAKAMDGKPSRRFESFFYRHTSLAQGTEHLASNQGVGGPNPSGGTTNSWPRGEASACKADHIGSNPILFLHPCRSTDRMRPCEGCDAGSIPAGGTIGLSSNGRMSGSEPGDASSNLAGPASFWSMRVYAPV